MIFNNASILPPNLALFTVNSPNTNESSSRAVTDYLIVKFYCYVEINYKLEKLT